MLNKSFMGGFMMDTIKAIINWFTQLNSDTRILFIVVAISFVLCMTNSKSVKE